MKILKVVLVAIVGLFLVSVTLFLWFFREALFVTPRDPEALRGDLAAHFVVKLPDDAAGPHPVALLFHGCGGTHTGTAVWADAIVDEGFAVVVVDSHAARGIGKQEALDRVCRGMLLSAGERAADVLVTLDWLGDQSWADTERIVAVGWSHGAWTLLETMSMQLPDQIPSGLTRLPQSSLGKALTLESIDRVALVYPPCGPGTTMPTSPLIQRIPALVILAGEDQLANPADCTAYAEREKARGWNVTTHVYPSVGHGFDVATYDGSEPNPKHDPTAATDAFRRVRAFLSEARAPRVPNPEGQTH